MKALNYERGIFNMKKRDLLKLNGVLSSIEGRQFSVKFSYFIAKNKVMIKNEFAILEDLRKPSPDYIAYDTKRAELAHKYADKDEEGKPKIENNNFVIVEHVDEFKKELDELKKKSDKAIKKHEKKMKDFEDLLDEDIDYQGPKIDFKDIPKVVEPSVLEVLIEAGLIIEEE
jgi:seryl-tRNA synthetase